MQPRGLSVIRVFLTMQRPETMYCPHKLCLFFLGEGKVLRALRGVQW